MTTNRIERQLRDVFPESPAPNDAARAYLNSIEDAVRLKIERDDNAVFFTLMLGGVSGLIVGATGVGLIWWCWSLWR